MHEAIWAIVLEFREFNKLLRELIHLLRQRTKDNVTGGSIARIE
jgi:hypothetical protein